MIIPPLLGNLDQTNFFIYAAADATYFDQHARALINSVLTNTPDIGVHIHIYDPRPDQLEFCRSRTGISVSYETLDPVQFNKVTARWLKRTEFANDRQRQMYKKGQTLGAEGLNLLVRQTYYACTRFIRLAELVRPGQRCLAIDVDGLVRAPFDHQLGMADFYLYEKPKDGTHLAGALLLNGTAGTHEFIKKYVGIFIKQTRPTCNICITLYKLPASNSSQKNMFKKHSKFRKLMSKDLCFLQQNTRVLLRQ